jgi:transposase
MGHRTVLPDAAELELQSLKFDAETIILSVRAARRTAQCPGCHQPSPRVHSHYDRKLADLPWNGIPVRVHLNTRRFFCDTPICERRIFTERLPNTAARHARCTLRLTRTFDWLALALGGQAGARLASRMGILTSGDSLLRQLRRTDTSIVSTPRVLGIDDWAWRKGQRYGTILCDLERGNVVDLLADRQADSVETWLRAHPGVEIITRDRASAYAEAARDGAPDAVQVADRWHLLRNLSEALRRVLESKHGVLGQAAKTAAASGIPPVETIAAPSPSATSETLHRLERTRQANRDRRYARYETVLELVRKGLSQKAISRTLGIDRRTVRRWSRADSFPERQTHRRGSSVDDFAAYLEQRWQQGCHNGTQLWRELQAQGFRCGQSIVRQWVQSWRPFRGRDDPQHVPKPTCAGSPRQTAWLLLEQPPEAQPYLQELYRRAPELQSAADVAREFVRIIRERDAQAWNSWLRSAKGTPLARFAAHLQRDESAVLAALRLHWSNGPVEGQVHRLKLIKRQMYGRAKFDLLRLRVVNAA